MPPSYLLPVKVTITPYIPRTYPVFDTYLACISAYSANLRKPQKERSPCIAAEGPLIKATTRRSLTYLIKA